LLASSEDIIATHREEISDFLQRNLGTCISNTAKKIIKVAKLGSNIQAMLEIGCSKRLDQLPFLKA